MNERIVIKNPLSEADKIRLPKLPIKKRVSIEIVDLIATTIQSRQTRIGLDISLRELSEEMGCSYQYLWLLERGKRHGWEKWGPIWRQGVRRILRKREGQK